MLSALGPIKHEYDLPLSKVTSFRIGGPVDLMVEPETPEELAAVVDYLFQEGISWFLLGRGSNLLVRDKGIRGVMVRLGKGFAEIKVEGLQIMAGAAVSLTAIAEEAARYGLTGLEFASGIPGTVGGATFMNAGAYDGEMRQVVTAVRVYKPGEGFMVLGQEELNFGYRCSRLQQENLIAVEVMMILTPGEESRIREKMRIYQQRRKEKQPLEYPSAGSVFRRPPSDYAGRLIEASGLRGKRIGRAEVSEKHAGFIINLGGATARDVLTLIDLIKKEVAARFHVDLETEIRVIGEE